MKPLLRVIVILVMFSRSEAALAAIRTHCLGDGPRVYLIGGGPAFTTWNLRPI